MKTTGAVWNAYLASWPDDQWFDDSDETFNGKEAGGESAPDDAVVEFSCGVVYLNEDDSDGVSLVSHFRRWLKAQSIAYVQCEVPKDRLDEFNGYMEAMGVKVKQS